VALALALGGCAQGSLPAGAPPYVGATQTLAWPAAHFYGNDGMYSSQPSANEVVLYRRQRHGLTLTHRKTLTKGFSAPMGMMTTRGGWWYIANSGASDVLVYHATRQGIDLKATLSDDGQVPVNVSVSPDRQLVAVSNGSTTTGSAGSVSVYVNGAQAPSRTLTYGTDPVQGEGVAIDAHGNCYWSFNDPAKLIASIVMFAGCSGSGTLFKSGILRAGGMAFDRSGNLYFVDQLLGIFKCSGSSSSSCGIFSPVLLGGLILPANINFDNRDPQNLWVADAAGYIDAVNLQGLIAYILDVLGGITAPPIGIAPASGS
jgi:DNA-binding beta-propeller fold protein YncE